MTAKKRWLKKIYQDSQELKSSQEKISWSSSESDEDVFNKYIHTKKKKKVKNNKYIATNWIKSTSDSEKYKQNFLNVNAEIGSSLSDFPFPTCSNESRFKKQVAKENLVEVSKSKEIKNVEYIHTKANSTKSFNCDSPIINSVKLEELSPVLTRNSNNFDVTNQVSPVLGQRRVLNKVRANYLRKHKVKQQVFQSTNTSPDLFTTQPTQVIDCDSPEFCTKDNLSPTESPIKPLTAPLTERIVPFPSQCGSEIKISDASGSCSSSTKTDSGSLYHQPARRKKNYKKGGLASLLQKALHLQRSRISIWQHELYTKKAEVDLDRGEVINFFIRKEWKTYGNTMLECEVSDNKCSNIVSSTNIIDQSFIFVVVVGYSTTLNIICKPGCTYQLLPPFSTKNIIYKSKEVPCCYNVAKLIMCKEKRSGEIPVS